MSEVRLNSEKKIESDDFKLKIGTTNKTNPIVVYIEGKAFISPTFETESYDKDVNDIKKHFKKIIRDNIKNNSLFEEKFILDLQIASSGLNPKKKSFIFFQFLLKQKSDKVLKLNDLKKNSETLIVKITEEFKKTILEHKFLLYKTKK